MLSPVVLSKMSNPVVLSKMLNPVAPSELLLTRRSSGDYELKFLDSSG